MIPEGEVTISVTDSSIPVDGANVYVYTAGGTYMGLYAATDASGEVSFLLPADGGNSTNYNGYKFRADYAGAQTYSDPLLVTADVNNPISIEVGGSAAVQSLRGAPATRQPRVNGVIASPERSHGRGNPGEVQVASLFMFSGILAGLTNSAIADSNGEHLYFYHSDHLGTPLFLTDVSGTVVWRGEYLPFGEVFSEDEDPDGDGVEVEQPFRFPGQYHDQEAGLYYNYFRDYDPQIGLYMEADPIGLAGGVNLWGYVDIVGKPSIQTNLYLYTDADPINLIDPLGLWSVSGSLYIPYGGTVSFGKDPFDNKWFLRGSVGVGLAAGISFDPKGGFPKPDDAEPCDKNRGFIGSDAAIGITLGPITAEGAWDGGIGITETTDGKLKMGFINNPYFRGGLLGERGFGLKAGGYINILGVGWTW